MAEAVIVTGASGGIGSAICEYFFSLGFEIVGLDSRASRWTDGKTVDLSRSDTEDLVRERVGSSVVRCVVHAAAEQVLGHIDQVDEEQWQKSMWTNFFALNQVVRAVAESLRACHGSVVLVGSVHTFASRPLIGAYSVSKAAAQGWVRAAALDYAPHVRVNAVVPGAIDAGKLSEYLADAGPRSDKLVEKIIRRTPLSRLGTPKDVAQAVGFLASEAASFITGQSLFVDGGATQVLATEAE